MRLLWSRWLFAVLVSIGTGCGVVLDLDPPDDAGGLRDAGATSLPDAGADSLRDAAAADGGGNTGNLDAGDRADGGIEPGCTRIDDEDPATVALYRFDGDLESNGDAPGAAASGAHRFVAGPHAGCGRALAFTEMDQAAYIYIEDDGRWDLSSGSIDLWLRPGDLPSAGAGASRNAWDFLSRDGFGTEPESGHLSFFLDATGRLAVRLQNDSDTGDSVLCSNETLEVNRWVHVAFNFGESVALYVDGVVQTYLGALEQTDNTGSECTGPPAEARGIDGNARPWVIGRGGYRQVEPLDDIRGPSFNGAIDHLRIRSAPIDFSRL